MGEEIKHKHTIRFHLDQTVCLTYFYYHEQTLAVFRLATDYPSETGYPLDNSRQTDNTTSSENGTVLIFDEQSSQLYPSVHPSILTDFEDENGHFHSNLYKLMKNFNIIFLSLDNDVMATSKR